MYDPLTESYPPPQQTYPDSYWASSTSTHFYPQLERDIEVDVAIIGGGYTGLSTAYHLAQNYGQDSVVLEANDIGWGCSGRNAGFVIPGTGRLSLLDIKNKWGEHTAQLANQEFSEAINTVKSLVEKGSIDCDYTKAGYLRLAHTAKYADNFKHQITLQQQTFSSSGSYKSATEINQQMLSKQDMFGGIYYPDCFGLNPLKLAHGYARMATVSGASLYAHSTVVGWTKDHGSHRLITPKGVVKCRKVVIASNGYSGHSLHKLIAKRHFPVLSSIIVTRPLSSSEQSLIAMKSGLLVMDTRPMKYYYRLLPDGRLLFGGRGAIKGQDADNIEYKNNLLAALKNKLPQLTDIQAEYFWSGWVSVTFDDYPRLWADTDQSIFYAMGYCGSGLSFATQAGKRLAQKITGDTDLPALPYYQSQLPKFPFPSLRRLGLSIYYKWANLANPNSG